jgi:hypothetical protein
LKRRFDPALRTPARGGAASGVRREKASVERKRKTFERKRKKLSSEKGKA